MFVEGRVVFKHWVKQTSFDLVVVRLAADPVETGTLEDYVKSHSDHRTAMDELA